MFSLDSFALQTLLPQMILFTSGRRKIKLCQKVSRLLNLHWNQSALIRTSAATYLVLYVLMCRGCGLETATWSIPGVVNRQKSVSIKINSNQVIFIDWQWKSVKIDKLNCSVNCKSILSIFHDFNGTWRKSAIVDFWHKLASTSNNWSANTKMRNMETIAHTTFSLKLFVLYMITKTVRLYNYIQFSQESITRNTSKDSLVWISDIHSSRRIYRFLSIYRLINRYDFYQLITPSPLRLSVGIFLK